MAQKNIFKLPYIGIDTHGDYDLLYGLHGEYSVIMEITNPVVQYSASAAAYDEFHSVFISLVKVLGGGYLLQKQDIFNKSGYPYQPSADYLQDKYNAHFAGREQTTIRTYLTITRLPQKGRFYVHDPKSIAEFKLAVNKVTTILSQSKAIPRLLGKNEIDKLVLEILSMDFSGTGLVLDDMVPNDTELKMGKRSVRSILLVDTDEVNLPGDIGTHAELNDKATMKGFPVDLFNFLWKVPGYETIIYNQVIEIPPQQLALNKLEIKKKRHSGIPDPANQLCVEDIDQLLTDVVRENQLLVNCHFNMMIACQQDDLQKTSNFITNALFNLGIVTSKRSDNQLELFRTVLPGNGVELGAYDWFLTTCDAALCFFFKEALPVSDPSNFLIRFTDRQGIPIGIDPADLPMRNGRISNRNKFVLGGSGTGKSFFVNSLVEQYLLYNMDVVIVDVGHSYKGLCTYKSGKYITYSDEHPITMNPFQIGADEYNIEKKDFLVSLIGLLWKGSDGSLNTVERDVIANVISSYYNGYFNPVSQQTDRLTQLNFNSFYEFALEKIPLIKSEDHIAFELDEFRYVLKKFYQGGEFDTILNEPADKSLFGEPFVIYEIDNLKDNKVLFPVVTLIIMDLFIQKMRHRKDRRKALILEEAWKALASPIMAEFLLYLNKTVRKFWGEIIEVTQELGDILDNPIVKDSIINNSDTVILMDQSNALENFGDVAKLLSITETERRKIFTINQLDNKEDRDRFKEFYMRRGLVGEIYGVEESIEQYLIFTTEKPEKSAIEIYVTNYKSYPTALDFFVSDYRQSRKTLDEFVAAVNLAGQPLQIKST